MGSWLAVVPGRHGYYILGILLALAIGLLVWQEYRYARKARYAEAIDNLLQIARECCGKPERQTLEECKAGLREMINETAEAFTLITGTRVSACIKQVVTPAGATQYTPRDLYVQDVCRDRKSEETRGKTKNSAPPLKHWIDQNTGYLHLFDGQGGLEGRHFASQDLARKHPYNSTSFAIYGKPLDEPTLRDRLLGRAKWPLPYRSTLTVPIPGVPANHGTYVAGFLSIDSASRRVLLLRYDLPLMETIARLVSPLLERYQQLLRSVPNTLQGLPTPPQVERV